MNDSHIVLTDGSLTVTYDLDELVATIEAGKRAEENMARLQAIPMSAMGGFVADLVARADGAAVGLGWRYQSHPTESGFVIRLTWRSDTQSAAIEVRGPTFREAVVEAFAGFGVRE